MVAARVIGAILPVAAMPTLRFRLWPGSAFRDFDGKKRPNLESGPADMQSQ
jgi:hypothetical protein